MSTIRYRRSEKRKKKTTNKSGEKILGKDEFSFFVEKCLKDLKKEIKGIIILPSFSSQIQ